MQEKGFMQSLFDFSFENFVFPKLVKFLYTLVIFLMALVYLFIVIGGFSQGTGTGLAALIFGPVIIILYLVFIRAWMEVTIVLFRIYENTNILAGKEKDGSV